MINRYNFFLNALNRLCENIPEVDYKDISITGVPSNIDERLIGTVEYIIALSHIEKFYIGIASGNDADEALKKRMDPYKRQEGINEMIALYRTSSNEYARCIESLLVDNFFRHPKNINRTSGGGGCDSDAAKHFVYIALCNNNLN